MGKASVKRSRRATALGFALLTALLAGCGGGSESSTPSEATLRAQLEAGVAKVGDAESLVATETVETAVPGKPDTKPTPVGCSDAKLERGPPLRIETTGFQHECGGGEGREAIAVGNQAWSLIEPGHWSGATLNPEVATEFAHDQTHFAKLIAAAEDVTEGPSGHYDFDAPASAFFDTARNPDLKLTYAVGIDGRGYLRRIVATAIEGRIEEIITLAYDQIDRPQHIVPPDPGEVSGPLTRIETRPEFEALLGPHLGETTDEPSA